MQNKSESQMIAAIERVIRDTASGTPVNDAVEKVARAEGFGPGAIETVVSAYNKSRAVNMLKKAAADDFELADSREIVRRIYSTEDTQKEAALQFPRGDYSKTDLLSRISVMQKAAGKDTPEEQLSRREAYHRMNKYAEVCAATERRLKTSIAESQYEFNKAIDNVLGVMASMSGKDIQKVANVVVNGYGENESGRKFMELCLSRLRRSDVTLQKTASCAVFPVREPFLSISKAFESAQKLASARNSLVFFSKEAGPYSMTKDLAMNLASNAGTALLGGKPKDSDVLRKLLGEVSQGDSEKLLDPMFYNKLKTLDAKRNVMELALYDKHLKKYDLETIIEAYNDVVDLNPEAYKSKALLKNLVLAHIESGNVRDPYSLATEISLADKLEQRYQRRSDEDRASRREDAEARAEKRDLEKLKAEKEKAKLESKKFKSDEEEKKDKKKVTKKEFEYKEKAEQRMTQAEKDRVQSAKDTLQEAKDKRSEQATRWTKEDQLLQEDRYLKLVGTPGGKPIDPKSMPLGEQETYFGRALP